jgi:hypothetical protein
MLFSADGKRVDYVPHEAEFKRRRSQLGARWAEIAAEINATCDEVDAVSWQDALPGTACGALLREILGACDNDPAAAAEFVDRALWVTLRQRSDNWVFHRAETEPGRPAVVYVRAD